MAKLAAASSAETKQQSHKKNMSAAKPPVVNPHAKRPPPVAHNEATMGRQSQQRVRNQHKRKYKLCSNNNNKRRKGGQLTLQGDIAFDAARDCKVCRAKEIRKTFPECSLPKRAHHELCSFNTKTKGLGKLTEQSIASIAESKRCKAITAPIRQSEKMSGANLNPAAVEVFFATRQNVAKVTPLKTMTTTTTTTTGEDVFVSPTELTCATQ